MNDRIVGWKYVENNVFHGAILFSKDYIPMSNCSILNEIFWWMSPEKRNTTYSYKFNKKSRRVRKTKSNRLCNDGVYGESQTGKIKSIL